MKIIFDYNRTLFNPKTAALYEGVSELLGFLAGKHTLYLVSRYEPGRSDKLDALGIRHHFQEALFVEKKTLQIFARIAEGSAQTIVVGDRLQEEIALGSKLGLTTIWLQQEKLSPDTSTHETKPTYTIRDIRDISNILTNYEK